MHIYFIGVCGTGMGSLACLLADLGHKVSGSDPAPRPPMSEVLRQRGIAVLEGFKAGNLDQVKPDMVVVGNVCRRDNPEAMRAQAMEGVEVVSMPGAIKKLLVPGRKPLVVTGTHGKTTTSSLLGVTLLKAGLDPTILVGGVVVDLDGSSRLGDGPYLVIEGDEYDSAFFEKVPKFWSYEPKVAVISSVDHDHLDIYPDEASYLRAFDGLIERIADGGLLVGWAGDEQVLRLATAAKNKGHSVRLFVLEADGKREEPHIPEGVACYGGRLEVVETTDSRHELHLTTPDGEAATMAMPLPGAHNARNAMAAAIVAREACGLDLTTIARAFADFAGVALRQQHVGTKAGVRVYRDFAHHPVAVEHTVRAMQPLARPGRLLLAYEPRTATACRRLHQAEYVGALSGADEVVLAPVGRPEIPDDERLDTELIARELSRSKGVPATAESSIERVVATLDSKARAGDLVLLLSNGSFGQAHTMLLEKLEGRDDD